MKAAEALFFETGQQLKGAEQGSLFGKPCFKIKGKAFLCFFEDEMVFKLTDKAHESALALKGAHLFDPSGKKRPMKEWVQVPYAASWPALAKEAMKYVAG